MRLRRFWCHRQTGDMLVCPLIQPATSARRLEGGRLTTPPRNCVRGNASPVNHSVFTYAHTTKTGPEVGRGWDSPTGYRHGLASHAGNVRAAQPPSQPASHAWQRMDGWTDGAPLQFRIFCFTFTWHQCPFLECAPSTLHLIILGPHGQDQPPGINGVCLGDFLEPSAQHRSNMVVRKLLKNWESKVIASLCVRNPLAFLALQL